MRTTLLFAAASLAISACSGEAPAPMADKPKAEAPKAEEPKAEEPKAEEPAAPAIEVGQDDGGEYPEVVIEPEGDQMKYATTTIELKANTKTRIKMQNVATVPAMVHNIVIVKKGSENEVGQAAMAAGEAKNYIPNHPDVLAATKLAKPGETTTVVVDMPAGEYAFICTFPGHYMMMKGTVTVTEG